jgi:FKBP-type peptidyl-prolyl cis-trans isomerase SlyD
MPIEANKVVTLKFTLTDEEGNVLDTTENHEPFSYISGSHQVIPKLENAVSQMVIGAKQNVKIDVADAYGEYDDKNKQQVARKNFPPEAEVKVGNRYIANSPEGKQMPFTVSEVEKDNVIIDFNHPLAGKNLEFAVELVDVRDATEEELNHGHVHNGNGYNH